MNVEEKNKLIKTFRDNGFNCFPIPKLQKIADFRYKASKTPPNLPIADEENYGVIGVAGAGNCIIDFDNKEEYRSFAKLLIDSGYLVSESPHGWHVPATGFSGTVSKMEFFNYKIQDKKIVEIQGFDHYCVGAGCTIETEGEGILHYTNRGGLKIWNPSEKVNRPVDFEDWCDKLCEQVHVEGRKKKSNSSYKNFRDRFRAGQIPTKGTSNDYFHQSAIACNDDGLGIQEAREKIEEVFQRWTVSEQYSGRTWDNVLQKIQEVYDKNQKTTAGRPQNTDDNPTSQIAQRIVATRKIYSNVDTDEIFENKNGFLELINNSLVREILTAYPETTQAEYNDILFKLKGYAGEIPETNKDFIVFKNGVLDKTKREIIETEELADMGFKEYDYLPKSPENEPTRFMKVLFDDTEPIEKPRIKAGLRAIFQNYLDPKISVLYGASGVGKSTPLLILTQILGEQYALTVELNQFLEDKFIRAKILGMRLVVFQDLPKEWKDFTTLKTLTGEQRKTERAFMKDSVTFDNKVKIWASGNYLAEIPEYEQDAMYTRRLSLIHNVRKTAHKEDPIFAEKIIADEAEKIVSWILNFDDEECEYEDRETVQKEWEETASPEIAYINDHWVLSDYKNEMGVGKLVKDYKSLYQKNISIDQMARTLKVLGFSVRNNIISNIEKAPEPPKPVEKEVQTKI